MSTAPNTEPVKGTDTTPAPIDPSGGSTPKPPSTDPPKGDVPGKDTPKAPESGSGGASQPPKGPETGDKGSTAAAKDPNAPPGDKAAQAAPPTTTTTASDPPPQPKTAFTKLHMIQADYGDTLLLQYRGEDNGDVKFWLTDGGPRGQKYGDDEWRASEHLFYTLNTLTPSGSIESGVPYLEKLIVTHPHADHQTGIDYLLRSLRYTGYAGVPPPEDGARPMSDVRLFSWRHGLNYVMKNGGEPPFANLWYNDKTSITWNVPITPGNLDPGTYAPPITAAYWMKSLLAYAFPTKTPNLILNSEFPDFPRERVVSNRKFNPPGPPYKAVSREVYVDLKNQDSTKVSKVDLLLPTVEELVKFVQESGFSGTENFDYVKNLKTARDGTLETFMYTRGQLIDILNDTSRTQAERQHALDQLRGTEKQYNEYVASHGAEARKVKDRWTEDVDRAVTKLTIDDAKSGNLISIVYEFNNNGTTSLFTGDNVGTLIQRSIEQKAPKVHALYDILKLPHHGSCYNVLAQFPANVKPASANQYQYSVNFFKYFKARNYCISGNVFATNPNPDLYTISGLVDGYVCWGTDGKALPVDDTWRTTNLILTNGISYNSFVNFKRSAAAHQNFTFNLWFMPRYYSWCTIDAVTGPDPGTLIKIDDNIQYYQYFQNELNTWYNEQGPLAGDLDKALINLAKRDPAKMAAETVKSVAEEKALDPNQAAKSREKKDRPVNHTQKTAGLGFGAAVKQKAWQKRAANAENAPNKKAKSEKGNPPFNGLVRATATPHSFRLPQVTVWLSEDDREIPIESSLPHLSVQADQGSDFNLISSWLVGALGLKSQSTLGHSSSLEGGSVTMRTIDGKQTALKQQVTLHLGVAGVRRKVQCFVLPDERSYQSSDTCSGTDIQLLLGLPWLHDVNAVIHVRDFTIELGDPSKGEPVRTIRTKEPRSRLLHEQSDTSTAMDAMQAPMLGRVFAAQSLAEGEITDAQILAAGEQQTTLKDIWHDFETSKFDASDLPDWKYFNEGEKPGSVPDSVPTPGQQSWVGLDKFIQLLERDNSIPSAKGDPLIGSASFEMLRRWLPSPKLYPDGADAVLGILLSTFFESSIAAEFLTALPLNPNGPTGFLDKLQTSTSRAAITLLPVHKLRFEVLPADPAKNTRLLVFAMYFELRTGGPSMPVPVIGPSIKATDIMTWRVPFANSTYQQGHINFVHNVEKGIRVKIVSPMYQNCAMIAHFDSQMNILRNPLKPISIPCRGTAYKKIDEGATYDIQFGDMDILDLFGYLYPKNDSFSSVFSKQFENLQIQRLMDIANKAVHIKAKDVGVVFRQDVGFVNSITLQDAYGTLSFDDSPISLDLPGSSIKLPLSSLPSLTLRLGNIAEKKGQSVSIALTKSIGDLGLVVVGSSFSRATMRPEFTFTLMCNPDVSLGRLVENGLGLVSSNCLDSDFLKNIHLGSLSSKSMADGISDALDHISIPYARIRVSKLSSGSYGVSKLELQLEIDDVSFPEKSPIIKLEHFEIRVEQERSGAPLPKNDSATKALSAPPSSGTSTSVYGSATIRLAGIDAVCRFAYDPNNEAELARMSIYPPSGPVGGRQLFLDVSFPRYLPTLGDLINQIVGEVGELANGGTFKAQLPPALHKALNIVALQQVQIMLASTSQENAPWSLTSFYVVVDLTGLIDLLEDIFDTDLPFEWPKLSVRVNNPTVPEMRTFEIRLTSIVNIAGSLATIVADISRGTSAIYPGDVVGLTYQWDSGSLPLTLSRVVEGFSNSISDEKLGSPKDGSYTNALRKWVPNNLITLVDDINLETIRFLAADFSPDKTKTKFGLAEIFVQIADTGAPWAPFGDYYRHLTFSKTRLGFGWQTGRPYATPANPNPKGSTKLTFSTLMQMKSLSLNIIFSFNKTATNTTFSLSLANIGDKNFTLVDLITNIVNDIGFASLAFPEDAKKLFDIDLASLSITYSKTIAPASPSESISVSQAGGATFLGVTVSSISIVADRTTGTWGYSLQVKLPPTVKPFAKVLPIPGVEDFTVANGFFSIFKGPIVPPTTIAPMLPPSGADGLGVFLSGSLRFEGNDFLNLCGTILKIPQIDFAVQSGGTLSIKIPVGKLELVVSGHPMFAVSTFTLMIAPGTFNLSADLDLLCEWLAPSIKESPIGFRFSLGIGLGGALNVSIYALDPKTRVIYPDMSTFPFIVRPFWIPGLVLYPFHFSMRWLAAAPAPEALAAGGGFMIQGTPMTNVFALSLDQRRPMANYVMCDIQELTISQIFGRLVPDQDENKRIFGMFNAGFKSLKININPGKKKFNIYADVYFFFLHGKVIADVDPTSGLAAAAKLDPVNLANGLIQLVSYNSGPTIGPFMHINTNVKDIVAGRVPQNPKTPEWAGMTSGDPKLDNSIFALTAKLVFLGFEFDIFGLLDQTGLLLYTYMGLNVALKGVKLAVSRQMSIAITSTMFAGSFGFKFDLEIEIPPSCTLGVPIGNNTITIANLDLGIAVQIRYDPKGWQNDGLVFEAYFHVEILGLVIDVPHMRLEITLKDLSELPGVVGNFIRDKVVDEFKDKLLEPVKEAWDKTKAGVGEAIDTMTDGFNMAEKEIGHAFTEAGQDIKQLADTFKNELGLGLDETVNAFRDLGKDISEFGDALAEKFQVPKLTVIEAVVEQGLCSVEHAFEAGLDTTIDKIQDIGQGIFGLAQDLGNIGTKALDELEEAGKKALNKIEDTADKAVDKVVDFGKDVGKAADKAIDKVVDFGKDVGKTADKAVDKVADFAKDVGKGAEKVVDKIGDTAKEGYNTVKKGISKILPPW